MNESIKTSNWNIVLNQENFICARRPVINTPSYLVKANVIIDNFNHEEIFNAIYNFDIRTTWDKVFKELKVIQEENTDENTPEIIYSGVKTTNKSNQ